MFGRYRHGLAQAQRVSLREPRVGGVALGLVDHDDDGRVGAAHQIGEVAVQRRDTGAPVDHHQNQVGAADRDLGLGAYARFQPVARRFVQSRRVDHGEAQRTQARLALAPVAGHAGRVVDQRLAAAGKPVEQGRFAHIGAPDDDDGGGHSKRVSARAGGAT